MALTKSPLQKPPLFQACIQGSKGPCSLRQKGLFFVCPMPVYHKIGERLGGSLRPYPIQPGSLTVMWYDIGPEVPPGKQRELTRVGKFNTTIDQVALAFTAPSNLPPSQVYENAIRASLHQP